MKQDQDILALKKSIAALDRCSSPQILRATLDFLVDRYLTHPSKDLPDHLKHGGKESV